MGHEMVVDVSLARSWPHPPPPSPPSPRVRAASIIDRGEVRGRAEAEASFIELAKLAKLAAAT